MLNSKLINKTFVHQQDSTDCGVACLLSLIRFYGGDSTIEYLRKISGTTIRGTSLLGLCQAAKSMGMDAMGYETNIEELIAHNKPIILHVTFENAEHYIVCYGYDDDRFIVSDPANGILSYSKLELENVWLSRKCLAISPSNAFVTKSAIKAQKLNWLRTLVRDDISLLSVAAIIGIVIAILGVVMAVFSQKLVDGLFENADAPKIIIGLSIVTILLLVRVGSGAIRGRLLLIQRKKFNNRIINFFYNKLLYLSKSFFDTRKTGDFVARLNDTRRIQGVVSMLVSSTIIDVLVVIVSLTFIFIYSIKIGIVATIAMPIFFFLLFVYNKRILIQQHDVMAGYSQTESNFINTIQGIGTIQNFNQENAFISYNTQVYSKFQDSIFRLGITQINIGLLASIIGVLVNMIIICIGVMDIYVYQLMTMGTLIAVMSMANSLFPSINNLAVLAIPINEAKVAFDRMFDVVNQPVMEGDLSTRNMIADVQEMKLQHIVFRFAGSNRLLYDINATFKKGTVTTIVGESGCGKSTLCQIIERFYLPENGSITIDGKDAVSLSLQDYRSLFAVVPQELFILNGTVLDNILFGLPLDNVERFNAFLIQYGFDRYFTALPLGLYTLVGEEGINLSGGQKQVVAFARALYRGAPILLLDEMTSAMDMNTEQWIIQLLTQIKQEKMVIFVTHRLTTARILSDQILVLENGSITHQGTHNELMQSDNFYCRYWNLINIDK